MRSSPFKFAGSCCAVFIRYFWASARALARLSADVIGPKRSLKRLSPLKVAAMGLASRYSSQ